MKIFAIFPIPTATHNKVHNSAATTVFVGSPARNRQREVPFLSRVFGFLLPIFRLGLLFFQFFFLVFCFSFPLDLVFYFGGL